MATEGSQTFRWEDDDLDDDNFNIHGHTLLYIVLIFSIILLITFFYIIYARFVARSPEATNFPTPPPSSQPQGLDAATINSFPITIHQRSPMSSSECSICLGVFEEGEKVKVLPSCCHCYHCECVDKWLLTHSTCPMCRTSVRVESPV